MTASSPQGGDHAAHGSSGYGRRTRTSTIGGGFIFTVAANSAALRQTARSVSGPQSTVTSGASDEIGVPVAPHARNTAAAKTPRRIVTRLPVIVSQCRAMSRVAEVDDHSHPHPGHRAQLARRRRSGDYLGGGPRASIWRCGLHGWSSLATRRSGRPARFEVAVSAVEPTWSLRGGNFQVRERALRIIHPPPNDHASHPPEHSLLFRVCGPMLKAQIHRVHRGLRLTMDQRASRIHKPRIELERATPGADPTLCCAVCAIPVTCRECFDGLMAPPLLRKRGVTHAQSASRNVTWEEDRVAATSDRCGGSPGHPAAPSRLRALQEGRELTQYRQ